MKRTLEFRAGRRALEILRDEGLRPDRIKVLAGASGGPKWLVLSGIDRVLPEIFKNRTRPLYVIGSSIGVWRSSALAQRDPLKAIGLFKDNYIAQSYSKHPAHGEVTAESEKILNAFLEDEEISYILNHPFMRIHIIAVRSGFPGSSDRGYMLFPYLGIAALMNLFYRPSLNIFFDRVLFFDSRAAGFFPEPKGFKTIGVPLSEKNYKKAVMATGSIPLVMSGITDIDGAPGGTYRDGGIIDYHPDIPFAAGPDDIVLFPHFYNRIVPGWFDKSIPWRKPSGVNMDNVLLVSPSAEFTASLPMKKIPDRNDFYLFRGRDEERMAYWHEAADKSCVPGYELLEAVNNRKIIDSIKPIETRL